MANSRMNNESNYVEEPFLAHLEKVGWTVQRWRGSLGDRNNFEEIILEAHTKAALLDLNPWLTENQADDLVTQLHSFTGLPLFERNREGDERLAVGLSACNEETGEDNQPVRLIDYDAPDENRPSKNRFLAVSQFRLQQLDKEIIPDIVLFVNGLPLVVVECKSSSLKEPFFDGVAQIERYKREFPDLFCYNQVVVSTSRHIAKYATITGNVEHYLEWKDPYPFALSDIDPSGGIVPSQEKLIWGMLSIPNFLDIVRNYMVWDGAVKKAPRYMQYRGARKLVERIRTGRKGGTIWHTQGSGKSLSMMYVIRQMHHSDDLKDWKIVLVVDRDDLEKQLRQTSGVLDYTINVAQNIKDAKQLLATNASDITLAMIHKFGETAEKDGQKKRVSVFPELNPSDKILVMIDEAHRSEYGELAAGMIKAMPNAVRIAFTGTPITATTNTFGGVFDIYDMRQAVEDGVVVEIRYEGRAEHSTVIDEDAMNGKFIDVFGYADDEQRQEIMGRYTLKGYMEAYPVIRAKAADMLEHYIGTVFQNGFKAQVAAFNREAAYRYKSAFEDLLTAKISALKAANPSGIDIALLEELKVECIISSGPDDANLHPHLKTLVDNTNKDAIVGEDGSFKTPFSKGGYTGIVIVSDMLLTGFDAPIEQVLYLDKKLVNHSLLQAIARVNRTYGKDKTCGYVVDYVGITRHMKEALSEYTALEGVAEEDKEPMLSVAQDIDRLNSVYNEILTFVRNGICYDIATQVESIIEELVANEDLRDNYNDLFKELSRYYDRVLPNPVALQYRDSYKRLAFIRASVASRTRDLRYSMKDASTKVRAIIEEYLNVHGVGITIPPIDILSPDFVAGVAKPGKSDRAIADELEYSVREYIIENTPRDPELFERFSEHLNKILDALKESWKERRIFLENFIRVDIANARSNENTYGYNAVNEMPFFALLREEIFGDKKFEELTKDEFHALKCLTDDCLSRLKADTSNRDFWEHPMQIRQTRAEIRSKLLDMEVVAPSVATKINDIIQRIIDLGKEHYK